MIQPNDVIKTDDKDWEELRKTPATSFYHNGPGTCWIRRRAGRSSCRSPRPQCSEKPGPEFPGYKIWCSTIRGVGMVVKRRSRVDPPGGGRRVRRRGMSSAAPTSRRECAGRKAPHG